MVQYRAVRQGLEQDLAIPIGMQDFSRREQRKTGNLGQSRYPAYHMVFSTRDMARLGYLMLRKGNWEGNQVVPKDWVEHITSPITPLKEMNPESSRDGDFAYGCMWWVWDESKAKKPYKGAYTARGAQGQYITVLPALDMVIAHKTKDSYGRSTGWQTYEAIIEEIIDSKIPKIRL